MIIRIWMLFSGGWRTELVAIGLRLWGLEIQKLDHYLIKIESVDGFLGVYGEFWWVSKNLHWSWKCGWQRGHRRRITADYRDDLVAIHLQIGVEPNDDVVGEHTGGIL